jgi:hypothetical protein
VNNGGNHFDNVSLAEAWIEDISPMLPFRFLHCKKIGTSGDGLKPTYQVARLLRTDCSFLSRVDCASQGSAYQERSKERPHVEIVDAIPEIVFRNLSKVVGRVRIWRKRFQVGWQDKQMPKHRVVFWHRLESVNGDSRWIKIASYQSLLGKFDKLSTSSPSLEYDVCDNNSYDSTDAGDEQSRGLSELVLHVY